jgi:hypothetical protein
MKKALLLAVALMMVASAANAGWIDLFSASTHDAWCLYPPPVQYVPITIYMIARPPADGFRATECKITIPDPCASITNVTYHPNMNLAFGEWPTGMSLSFSACMLDPWVLCATIQVLSLDCAWSTDCQVIELSERNDSEFLGFATCGTGFPPEAAGHQFNVYLNCDPCPDIVATEDASWGAIKNLYR